MSANELVRRYLSIRSSNTPTFSPSGKRIAFLSDITGVPQVWSTPVRGGWSDQLTPYDERVSFARHSPSGDALVFGMDQGGDEHDQLYLLTDDGEVSTLTNHPEAIHSFGEWSPDGTAISFAANRRDRAFFDVYVQEVGRSEPAEARQVLQRDGIFQAGPWMPDGRHIIVMEVRSSKDNNIHLLDLETGGTQLLTPHADDVVHADVCPAPDGRNIFYRTDAGAEFLYVAYQDLWTGAVTRYIERPWDIEHLKLSPDGRLLAYVTNVDGYSVLNIRHLPSDHDFVLDGMPTGVIDFLAWSADSRLLAFTFHGPRHAQDVWVVGAPLRPARRITKSPAAGLPQESFTEPDLMHYATFDSLKIPTFVYLPRNRTPPFPVVVHVHGGPEAQARPMMNFTIQLLVSSGFAVMAPNVRGSTGYGRGYKRLDDVRSRPESVEDLKYANAWLRQTSWADPDRISIYGGSYGGFMVLAALTSQPKLWAAGVDICGIANFETFLRNTGAWRRKHRAAEYGDPEKDRDFLREISPINHVDKIEAPLLVIHGVNDPRVPVSEAEQIVKALQVRNVPVRFLKFDDEGHGVVKLKNRITMGSTALQFITETLRLQMP